MIENAKRKKIEAEKRILEKKNSLKILVYISKLKDKEVKILVE